MTTKNERATAAIYPVPTDWPDVFDPEAAEAAIAVTLEEHGNAPGIVELVVELRWAIAQLRAERAPSAKREFCTCPPMWPAADGDFSPNGKHHPKCPMRSHAEPTKER